MTSGVRYPVTLIWPSNSNVGVPSGHWTRLEDGRIEATYESPEELGLAMEFAKEPEPDNGRRPLNDQPVPIWDLQRWLDQRGLQPAGTFRWGKDKGLVLEVEPSSMAPTAKPSIVTPTLPRRAEEGA